MSVVADAPVVAAPIVEAAPVIAGAAPIGAAFPTAFPAGFGGLGGFNGLGGFSSFGAFPTAAPVAAGFSGFPSTFGATAFPAASFGGFGAPSVVAGGANAALALDAADGVIDGKFAGRPIVNAGAPAFGTFGAAPAAFTSSFAPTVTGVTDFGFPAASAFGAYPAVSSGFVGAAAPVAYAPQAPFVQEAYPAYAPTFSAPIAAPTFAPTVSGAIAAPVAPARKVWQNGARRSLVTGHPTRF